MRFAVTNAKGEFTGTQYEAINDRIMAHHAQYGETIVAIDRRLEPVDDERKSGDDVFDDAQRDYGKPTAEELARPVVTPEQQLRDMAAAIAALSERVVRLEAKGSDVRQ